MKAKDLKESLGLAEANVPKTRNEQSVYGRTPDLNLITIVY